MKTNHDVSVIEESFHDDWAATMKPDQLDVYAAFTAETTPEFHFAYQALGDLHGKRLLDLGCGPGETSIFLANQGAIVTAVDISSGMIRVAKRLASQFDLSEEQLTFLQMSVEDLGFPDASFDLVFGSNVLHHCDTDRTGEEIARVLKPGGRAVFIDPLGYNPIIQIYRKMAFKVRTPTEHPLLYRDVEMLSRHFKHTHYKEFQLMTLLIFIWFFFGERIHPSNERYWRKFVLEGKRYSKAFSYLYAMDKFLLEQIPFLRRFCWVIVNVCDR
ncbi:MAG: class I SAM-dependent methyltransferase [Anaerolineales bacterium]|nr:class I SAM-dependent methyltransferase [Anaerolineales bacterium]